MKKIIVLVGPSGSGKTSLANILSSKGFYKPITCTTREKRVGEEDSVDYFFLSEVEFIKKKDNQELVDYDKVFSTWYGVERKEFEKNDQNVVMPATFIGVANLRKHFDNVQSIFLNPPSEEILIQRMKERMMSPEMIEKRIKNIRFEMLNLNKCDYVISTNQTIEKSCKDLERIIC
ncbi:guanylate kinase [Candidatus Cytomitobacter primus]|uniref:AAA family ATPase n=1 Tax=Candidatus Cytomitobacter primus TaxID=2066024 RepID=A0A5C0UF59_9PROT|nr:AAA family ATPase [Candidatus Cytomitobacter primus]QEK38350.1 AAA family ATPase [Candidatus Cytomitobacter primus]